MSSGGNSGEYQTWSQICGCSFIWYDLQLWKNLTWQLTSVFFSCFLWGGGVFLLRVSKESQMPGAGQFSRIGKNKNKQPANHRASKGLETLGKPSKMRCLNPPKKMICLFWYPAWIFSKGIHGSDIFHHPWLVDVCGKCRINLPYIDPTIIDYPPWSLTAKASEKLMVGSKNPASFWVH